MHIPARHFAFVILSWFLLCAPALAQQVDNLKKNLSTGNINTGFDLPSGQTIRIESGASIIADAGSTVTGFGSAGAWGTITGTLSNQTDLNTALGLKLDTATAATTYQPLSSTLTTLSSATAAGLALMDDATATAQRTTLGLGTLATQNGTITDYLTTSAAAVAYQPLSTILTTFSGLASAAGLLNNDGSGTLNYLATTSGGNGVTDNGKVVISNAGGLVGGGTTDDFGSVGVSGYSVTSYGVLGDSYGDGGAGVQGVARTTGSLAGRFQHYDAAGPTTATLEVSNLTNGNKLTVLGNGTITAGIWNGTDIGLSYLEQGSALSVLGVTGNATADNASIAAATDNQVLRRNGTALAFGAVNLASSDAITGTLPVANGGTGITAFGTGVATALGVNVGSAGAFIVNGGALGTPSSGTLTNATGLPISTGVSGLGTGVATTLATNLSITGGGTIALGGFTLTVPATGTVALLGAANTFTGIQTITNATASTSQTTGALVVTGGIGVSGAFRGGSDFELMSTWGISASTGNQTMYGPASLSWGSNLGSISSPMVLSLWKDADDTLAQRRGTNAQKSRVYNTYTSSTNYERGAIEWVSNVMRIGTQKGSGGGTARDMILMSDDTERMRINSSGITIGSGTAIAKVKHGTATLVAGTVTVSDSDVVAGSRILINRQTDGGTLGDSYSVTITAATNFVIQSKTANANVAGDTSTVSWIMVNP